MKPKSADEKSSIDGGTAMSSVARDENRSFINFSRENLSISDLEQGFNKPSKYFRPNRQNILSFVAIILALVCTGIEIWKLHRVIVNSRDIEIMKDDIGSLRHRLFGNDFMDELKALEEQLYGDEGDEDSGEADVDGADYDSNYDEDYRQSWHDDVSDEPRSSTTESPRESSSVKNESASDPPSRDHEIVEVLATLYKSKRGKENTRLEASDKTTTSSPDGKKSYGNSSHSEKTISKSGPEENRSKRRRAVPDDIPSGLSNIDGPTLPSTRNYYNRTKIGKPRGVQGARAAKKKGNPSTTEETPWDRRPPKKYFATARSDDISSLQAWHSRPRQRQSSTSRRRGNSHKGAELTRRSLESPTVTRRNLRAPRQIFAAHYGADSTLFNTNDEHTGNGRAKHNEGIFKAWRASDWVTDLGMMRHFTLSQDGRLNVHEPGLYLVYGQIHYLDEHDENGFHILVNGKPILQCMVYSPGTGHKSRSCFSAQITMLEAGDRLVLKDVGPARYTLFQPDKSFFGLVKIGDSRQQPIRHATQNPSSQR